MRAEMISVSNDLLNGRTQDQNAAFLTRRLTHLGIQISQSTMVVDDEEILVKAIEGAEEHANIIILMGGLGPDGNDITKQVISKYLDVPLVLDKPSEDKIITYHKNSNFKIPDNNQLQALILFDSIVIPNATGLAAGIFYQGDEKTYILLPGPFDELKPTYQETVENLLIEKILHDAQFETRFLRVFGLSEAELNERLEDFLAQDNFPIVAFYEMGEETEIEITTKSTNKEEATIEADQIQKEIKERLSHYVFAEESKTLKETVRTLLLENELTVTAAESLTGGEFLSAFSSLEGAIQVLAGGMVTYSTEVKNEKLGVSKEITDKFGVVSAQCAIEMATKAKDMFESDIGVSLTGVAGPTSLEGEIPGTVWIGLAKEGMESFAKKFHFAYKRNKNRRLSVSAALNLIRQVIVKEPIEDTVRMNDKAHSDTSGEKLE